jgi:hypothetical protein
MLRVAVAEDHAELRWPLALTVLFIRSTWLSYCQLLSKLFIMVAASSQKNSQPLLPTGRQILGKGCLANLCLKQ